MREIKFRGKRVDNGEWVYGYYAYEPEGWKGHQIFTGNYDKQLDRETYNVIPETVGQFTGLQDKDGVNIYEGDALIIEIEDEDSCCGNVLKYNGIVIYGREYRSTGKTYRTDYPASFTIYCKEWWHEEGLLGSSRHLYTVTGNIHDKQEEI